jgi:hypothetical protein
LTEKVATDEVSTEKATPATESEIASAPAQSQLAQDKGYIKVVFVDYGAAVNSRTMMQQQNVAGNILGVGNSTQQDMRNNIFVIVGVKLIFLVALLGLLFAIFKKIFHRIRRRKENVRKVHIVRQMPKARTRVVRIAKRKNN